MYLRQCVGSTAGNIIRMSGFPKWVSGLTWYHPVCRKQFEDLARCAASDMECLRMMDAFRECQHRAIQNTDRDQKLSSSPNLGIRPQDEDTPS